MTGVKPYISFAGNCQEAINFYRECLGAETLYVGTYGESPMPCEETDAGKIMHATLQIGDSCVMMCDAMQPVQASGNISLAVGTDDAAKTREMFNKMASGGTVTMPLQETFWAKSFGMLTDKFGINWMFNCENAEKTAE